VKIIGVGDAGANILGQLQLDEYPGVRRIAVNTDVAALARAAVPEKLQIGAHVTRGMSTGGEPTLGVKAAESDVERLGKIVAGTDLLILVTGLGGGTGGGAAAIVAQAAVRAGVMVIAFAAMPFTHEGSRRAALARESLSQLSFHCEAVIPVYNDLLLPRTDETASATDVLSVANGWIERGVSALCAMLFKPGLPNNIDCATLRSFFPASAGTTLFVFGSALGSGAEALWQALKNLLTSPLAQRREVNSFTSLIVLVRGWPAPQFQRVTEVVAKIAEEFGGQERRLQSIIADPAFGEGVEICVLGSVGGVLKQTQVLPRPVGVSADAGKSAGTGGRASAKTKPHEQPFLFSIEDSYGEKHGVLEQVRAVARRITGSRHEAAQEEIAFPGGDFFQKGKGEGNVVDGQDLDIPTFTRRKIEIEVEPPG
jgi:cell division protein FtsZ